MAKKILVKDWPDPGEIPNQFYIKDWSFGIERKPRFYRYTLSGKKWKVKSFLMDNDDLIETEIPFDKFSQIQSEAN